jgi:diketogulonate reductase-like aldo/keto reductase
VWQGLIAARRKNLTRAIGVSHFGAAQLEALVNATGVAPAVNQCGMFLGGHDDATIAYCEAHGITYEAYGALRDVNFGNAVLAAIAARHAVSAAQVALRFVTQFGGAGAGQGQGHPLAVSPGTNVQYAKEDLELGAFTLTDDDMAQLAAI